MISISLKRSNMALVSAQKCWDFFLTVLSVVFSSEASCKLAAGRLSVRRQAV